MDPWIRPLLSFAISAHIRLDWLRKMLVAWSHRLDLVEQDQVAQATTQQRQQQEIQALREALRRLRRPCSRRRQGWSGRN